MRPRVGIAAVTAVTLVVLAALATMAPWLAGEVRGVGVHLNAWELWVVGWLALGFDVVAVALCLGAVRRRSPWWWRGAATTTLLATTLAAMGLVTASAVRTSLGFIPTSWVEWLPDRSDEWVPEILVGQVPDDPRSWIPQLGPGWGLWVACICTGVATVAALVAAARAPGRPAAGPTAAPADVAT